MRRVGNPRTWGSGVADRLTDVGREVNDKLAVNDEVVVEPLEIQCEYFCIASVGSAMSALAYQRRGTGRTMTAQFQIDNVWDPDVHDG